MVYYKDFDLEEEDQQVFVQELLRFILYFEEPKEKSVMLSYKNC